MFNSPVCFPSRRLLLVCLSRGQLWSLGNSGLAFTLADNLKGLTFLLALTFGLQTYSGRYPAVVMSGEEIIILSFKDWCC